MHVCILISISSIRALLHAQIARPIYELINPDCSGLEEDVRLMLYYIYAIVDANIHTNINIYIRHGFKRMPKPDYKRHIFCGDVEPCFGLYSRPVSLVILDRKVNCKMNE